MGRIFTNSIYIIIMQERKINIIIHKTFPDINSKNNNLESLYIL
jgi:hypothetical protein